MAPLAKYAAAFCSSTLNKGNTIPSTNTRRPHMQCLHPSLSPTRLSAGLEIRDWEGGDGTIIMDLLQSVESGFNPEGPLETDCGSELLIRESYSEDGACMLIAKKKADGNGDDYDKDTSGAGIVGTAALIVGTPVTYLKSGASMSTPVTTGAIRRVCAVGNDNDNGDNNGNKIDDAFILQNLLMQIESRAAEAGVDELVVLAYPATARHRHRPNAALLEQIGYAKLPATLEGVDVEHYGKTVDVYLGDVAGGRKPIVHVNAEEEDSIVVGGRASVSTRANGVLQDVTIAVSFLGAIALTLIGVATFMGFELIPSNDGNRGIGSPLSIQELAILRQEEKLQRTDLDGGREISNQIGGRQWDDLSFEERQEEGALMKIIQGQDVRLK